ncbi:hypothetical protein ATANTOWER_016761, partial [Ataeniobius toweri]|nr:hypothetical protein [Ataeniobius toweri]
GEEGKLDQRVNPNPFKGAEPDLQSGTVSLNDRNPRLVSSGIFLRRGKLDAFWNIQSGNVATFPAPCWSFPASLRWSLVDLKFRPLCEEGSRPSPPPQSSNSSWKHHLLTDGEAQELVGGFCVSCCQV